MVDKKQVRRNLGHLKRVKTWQLMILFILACFVSATFLRLNNIGMVQRRDAVYAADKSGDDKITQSRLYDLQRFVTSHMNTDMEKGAFLTATYNRDKKALIEQASAGVNGNIYKKAQEVCAPQFTSWSPAYVQCSVNELAKYPAGNSLNSSINLPTSPYLYSYTSPLWTPDFAGWSVVVSVVILLMIIIRFISVVILRLMLRQHYKSI